MFLLIGSIAVSTLMGSLNIRKSGEGEGGESGHSRQSRHVEYRRLRHSKSALGPVGLDVPVLFVQAVIPSSLLRAC